ncbi:Peptidase C39, bacteriocin processing [Beggiatoa sp. PS]|nr:Peptidase C39, bacteriocin processing [Beggiatoa sp. PS]
MKNPFFPLICCTILVFFITGCASVSEPHSTILSMGDVRFEKPIKTWKDMLEQNIVMQHFDYSCGAGAMATLMRYYFQENITEQEILDDIMRNLDETEIKNRKEEGFSLFDLQQFAKRRGYQAVGVKLPWSALPKLRGPILVYLETPDYLHFAILRGVKGDRIFLADPGRGNLRMSVAEFSKEWDGIALVLGKKGFRTSTNYPLKIREEELIRNELNVVRNRGLYRRF